MSVEWIISLQHSLEMNLSEQYQGLSISQVNKCENESREWTLPQGTQWEVWEKKDKNGVDLLLQLIPLFQQLLLLLLQNLL